MPDWGSGNRSLQDEAPDWEGPSVHRLGASSAEAPFTSPSGQREGY